MAAGQQLSRCNDMQAQAWAQVQPLAPDCGAGQPAIKPEPLLTLSSHLLVDLEVGRLCRSDVRAHRAHVGSVHCCCHRYGVGCRVKRIWRHRHHQDP